MQDFRSMSDLVADAEDLVSKIGNANSPEVRALKDKVEVSITEMKDRFREKVKASAYAPTRVATGGPANLWLGVLAGAAIAAALLNNTGRGRTRVDRDG